MLNYVPLSMRMEAGLVESGRDMVRHVTRVGYVRKVIRKTKRTRRIVRPPQAVSMALQDLFMSCLDMFKGPGTVPSHQDVQKLSHIIGTYVREIIPTICESLIYCYCFN